MEPSWKLQNWNEQHLLAPCLLKACSYIQTADEPQSEGLDDIRTPFRQMALHQGFVQTAGDRRCLPPLFLQPWSTKFRWQEK